MSGCLASIADIPGILPTPEALLQLMAQDKKVKGGKLALVLVRGIGKPSWSAMCHGALERIPRAGVRSVLKLMTPWCAPAAQAP